MAISGSFTQQCPSCEAKVPIKDSSFIGKKVDCPKCKYRFVVETPAGAEKKPEASPAPPEKAKKKEPAVKSKAPAKETAAAKDLVEAEHEVADDAGGKAGSGKQRPAAEKKSSVRGWTSFLFKAGSGKQRSSAGEQDSEKGEKKKTKPRNTKLLVGAGLAGVGLVLLVIAGLALFSSSPKKTVTPKPNIQTPGPNNIPPNPDKQPKPGGAKITKKDEDKGKEKPKAIEEPTLVIGLPATAENTNFLPPTSEAVYHCCFKDFLASTLGKTALGTRGAVSDAGFRNKLGFSLLHIDDIVTAESFSQGWTFHVVHTMQVIKDKDLQPLIQAMDLKDWAKAPAKQKCFVVSPQSAGWLLALAKLPLFVPAHVLNAQSTGAPGGPFLLHQRDPQTLIFAHEKPMLDYLNAGGKIEANPSNVAASKKALPAGTPTPLLPDGYLTVNPPLREVLMRVEAKSATTDKVLCSAASYLRSPVKLPKELDLPGKGALRVRPMWDVVYLLDERTDRLEYVGASLVMKDFATYTINNRLTCSTDKESKQVHHDLTTKVGPEVVQFFSKVLGNKVELADDKAKTPIDPKASRITVVGHDKVTDFTIDLQLGEALARMRALVQLLAISLNGEADIASGQDFKFQLAEAGKMLGQKGLPEPKVPAETFPKGVFPRPPSPQRTALEPGNRVSWMAGLLPYLGQDSLLSQIHFDKSWRDSDNWMAARTLVPQFLDPTFPVYSRHVAYPGMPLDCATTHYVGIAGVGVDAADAKSGDAAMAGKRGVFGYDRMTSLKMISEKGRGLDNTILMIRVSNDGPAGFTSWLAGGGSTIRTVPEKNSLQPFLSTNAKGEGGTNALMCNGQVRFLKKGMSDEVFKALCTVESQLPDEWDWDEDSLVTAATKEKTLPPKGEKK